MSATPRSVDGAVEAVAGFMAAAALLATPVMLVYRPVRLGSAVILIALVAAALGGRHSKLAEWAIWAWCAAWIIGMTIAVLAERPLY